MVVIVVLAGVIALAGGKPSHAAHGGKHASTGFTETLANCANNWNVGNASGHNLLGILAGQYGSSTATIATYNGPAAVVSGIGDVNITVYPQTCLVIEGNQIWIEGKTWQQTQADGSSFTKFFNPQVSITQDDNADISASGSLVQLQPISGAALATLSESDLGATGAAPSGTSVSAAGNSGSGNSGSPASSSGGLQPSALGQADCHDAQLSDQSVYAQIAVSGTTCAVVHEVAPAADQHGGAGYQMQGFTCRSTTEGEGSQWAAAWTSTYYAYTCKNGSEQMAFNWGRDYIGVN